jgi:hypothetical protein
MSAHHGRLFTVPSGQCTVERSARPVHAGRSPNDWRFLHRGNDRDVLQRTHKAEHEWLRVARRIHIEQWGRIKRRICIERRWWHQLVYSAMRERTSVQRTLQLTKQLMATSQASDGPDARIAQAPNR